MKFKVGDKVRVRKDLEVDKRYGSHVFVDGMQNYRGKVMEVESIWNDEYYLKETVQDWAFTDEMLEPIEDPLVKKIEERNNKPVKMISDENLLNDNDPIKPVHYKTGDKDLFDELYRTYPFNEFREAMETLRRLKEYKELVKENGKN